MHPIPFTGTELIPNLYNFVRDTVDDVIADLIVVPNMVAVPIAAWPRGIQGNTSMIFHDPLRWKFRTL